MAVLIEHKDFINMSELSLLAHECVDVLQEPQDYEAQDIADAKETLLVLKSLLSHFGYHNKADDEVAEYLGQLERDSSSVLIANHAFEAAMEEEYKDLHGFDFENLPPYVEAKLDLDSLKMDFSGITLDGKEYYARR